MTKLEQLIQELCPDGVEYKRFDVVCSLHARIGWQRLTKAEYKQTGEYLLITGTDFTDNHEINYRSCVFVSKERYLQDSKIQLENEDILITKDGTLGKVAQVNNLSLPATLNGGVFVVRSTDGSLMQRFILHYLLSSHFLKVVKQKKTGSTISHLTQSLFSRLTIPVPPLEVQAEIVRILDKFTELTTELTTELATELTNRKKQYEYYRDSLLTDNNDIKSELKTVGELSKFRRGSFPQPYGNKEWYDGEGAMPFVQVADIGDNMRLVENTKRKISILAQPKSVFAPKGSIIISLQGSIGRIAVTQYDAYIDRTVAIFSDISDRLIPKYFVYQLQRIFSIKEKTARGSTIKTITKEEFTSFPIHIPPIEEQRRIVDILDRFDKICNDISEGLPAEIEARQKQYEYYRDLFLSFRIKRR